MSADMTVRLEEFAFACVAFGFVVLTVGAGLYFIVRQEGKAWACIFALVFLGATVFREVRLRREVPT